MIPSGVAWRKSSYSTDQGNCVEAAVWHKSSYSTGQGNCVEVGSWRTSSYSTQDGSCVAVAADAAASDRGHVIVVRDSKDPHGGILAFGPEQWQDFTASFKAGGPTLV